MDLGLKGKVVVITGGSQGIGKAAALEFLREGAICCVTARTASKLQETKEEFAKEGFELHTWQVDVTDYEAMDNMVQEVNDRFGKIDVWLNNAAIDKDRLLLDWEIDDFRRYVETDFISVFAVTKSVVKRMKNTGGGVIMNASSFTSIDPTSGKGPYASSKAAVDSLTRMMAAEFAPYNIRVLSYLPGMIRTPMSSEELGFQGDLYLRDIPMRRFGTPEDLAKPLVFLASDAAGYINGVQVKITGAKRAVQNPQFAWTEAGFPEL